MGNNPPKSTKKIKTKKKDPLPHDKNSEYFTNSVKSYYRNIRSFDKFDLKKEITPIFINDSENEELGAFNHGQIFKAYNKPTKKYVLIKKLKKKKIDLNKLQKDLKFFEGKKIPNILNLLSHSEDPSCINLFFEYPQMINLEIYTLNLKKISLQKLKFFTFKILKALEYIHSNNLYHGEINPQNIFIYRNGEIKLSDFGTKKYLKQNLSIKMNREISYQSLDAIDKNIFCRKNDIWGLGCVLYELVKGKNLFMRNNFQGTFDNIKYFKGNLKFEKNTDVFLMDFIKECMEIDSKKRKNVFVLLNHEFVKNVFLLPSENSFKSDTNGVFSDFNSVERNTLDENVIKFKENHEKGVFKERKEFFEPKLRNFENEKELYDDIIDMDVTGEYSFRSLLNKDKNKLFVNNEELRKYMND